MSSLSWHPVTGGRRAWIRFEDDRTYDLSGCSFNAIADRMMSGQYYPPDAVRFSGRFADERRTLRVGDRVLQVAPLLGVDAGPKLFSSVEIFVAERAENYCKIGYVTTEFHFGRGIWTAELTQDGNALRIRVKSTACPNSWLFWLGLPFGRALQLRARRRAIEEFKKPRSTKP